MVTEAVLARSLPLISALSIGGGAALAFAGLEGDPWGPPRLLELALWAQLFALLVVRLATRPRSAERAAELGSLTFGLWIFWSLRAPALFFDESAARAQARAAAALSSTGWLDLPYAALGAAGGILALAATAGLLVRQWFEESARPSSPRAALVAGWTAALGVFAFGSLALLGYATGSWSLLVE